MGFLVRSAFWFSLVLLFLPITPRDAAVEMPQVSPFQALGAAREAIGDVSGLCERKPDVCETGRAAIQTIGIRARESARIAYELLDEQLAAPDTSIATGGVPAIEPGEAAEH